MEENKLSDVAKKEQDILNYWNENDIFQKSLQKDSPKGDFVFYDGPPFATGLPHHGHLLPGTIKDVIPRYKTMQGYRVERKWGWDCHGLPIENLMERELGLNTKKDIEEYGIDKFNEAARSSVLRYEKEWKETIPRTGRWVDMTSPYKSMDSTYTESIWWSFKELFQKDLVYESQKSMHLCPRCETTLSNFEVNQGYKDIKDLSVIAKFKLKDRDDTYILAWTTTPWTLPGNVALAVNPDTDYVTITDQTTNQSYICAKEVSQKLFSSYENPHQITQTQKGSDLVGLSYEPLFTYYHQKGDLEYKENGWKVYSGDFVTTEDGSGIVHIAPAFGEDDLNLKRKHNLPFIQHVNKSGRFTNEVVDFVDLPVKPKDDHMSADIQIVKWLAHNDKLFSKEKYEHSYPHCWRCDTPLLNYATSSWFVDIQKIKAKVLEENQNTNWVPNHIKDGRFGKWLEGARDWALSRSRYWGAVLPVWQNKDKTITKVIGSYKELKDSVVANNNRYFAMRHGHAQNNEDKVYSSKPDHPHHLTEKGIEEVKQRIPELKEKNITHIYVSPFVRTKETAEMLKDALGIDDKNYIIDDRLSEIDSGDFDQKDISKGQELFKTVSDYYDIPYPNGETSLDVRRRIGDFLFDIESKHKNDNILIITHSQPLWQLHCVATGLTKEESVDLRSHQKVMEVYLDNAHLSELDFWPYPHNHDYIFDVHRPYIDDITLVENGETLHLIKEVFDVWYESGSMPYASLHYPFENKDLFDNTRYPANFIAESLDQTRGWFYVLLILGTALFDRSPYQNVIVSGLILAEDGKKMSKRLKNYTPVNEILDTLGADALRLHLMQSPAVKAEEFRLSDKDVRLTLSKVLGRLRNVVKMYKLYDNNRPVDDTPTTESVLDIWIIERLKQTKNEVEKALENYEVDYGARPIYSFVDDLSTWYVRRKRDRLKEGSEATKSTLGFILKNFAQIIAPYTPFIAEEIWRSINQHQDIESIHLSSWPNLEDNIKNDVINNMAETRNIVTESLLLRDQANIKVRQPLASLTVKTLGFKTDHASDYLDLIKDELNVKEVKLDENQTEKLILDTNITKELKKEGQVRELLRLLQSARKSQKLIPSDTVTLKVNTSEEGQNLIKEFEVEIKETAGITQIEYDRNTEENTANMDNINLSFSITKN